MDVEADLSGLPDLLARVAAAVSPRAALQLAADLGGRSLHIPAPERLRRRHPLVQAVGAEAAEAIARELGAGWHVIPLGPFATRRRVARQIGARLYADSARRIARSVGVHERTVHRHRAAHRRAGGGDQGDLFDGED